MGCLPAKLERAIDCMRLIAGRYRPAVVGHFGHLRKLLASFAAQLFGRGALVGH